MTLQLANFLNQLGIVLNIVSFVLLTPQLAGTSFTLRIVEWLEVVIEFVLKIIRSPLRMAINIGKWVWGDEDAPPGAIPFGVTLILSYAFSMYSPYISVFIVAFFVLFSIFRYGMVYTSGCLLVFIVVPLFFLIGVGLAVGILTITGRFVDFQIYPDLVTDSRFVDHIVFKHPSVIMDLYTHFDLPSVVFLFITFSLILGLPFLILFGGIYLLEKGLEALISKLEEGTVFVQQIATFGILMFMIGSFLQLLATFAPTP